MEQKKRKHAFIVGIFTAGALLILIAMVFTLGGEKNTFTKKFPLKVIFTDINGLNVGNNVWFYGVRVGTVKDIRLRSASKVEVTLSIDEKVHSFIHKDAMVKISSEDLLGNKLVVILDSSPAAPIIESNDYLTTQVASGNEDIMAVLKETGKNLMDISADIKQISRNVNLGKGTLGKLINDPSVLNTLQNSLSNFKDVSLRSKNVIDNIESFTQRMNTTGSTVNNLFSDTATYDSITNFIAQLKEAAGTANVFSNNMKTFSENMTKSSRLLLDSANTAGMILNSAEMAQELQRTVNNLESGSRKMDEVLEALQHSFLFRGYFRRKQNSDLKKAKKKEPPISSGGPARIPPVF